MQIQLMPSRHRVGSLNTKGIHASKCSKKKPTDVGFLNWLREKDLNLRPLGYEPNELPDCSIARYVCIVAD